MQAWLRSRDNLARAGWALWMLAIVCGALVPVPEFWITLANYIGLYSLVALGLVLMTGIAGMTSFGQAAFVGLGAYASAVLTTSYAASPWIGLLAGLALVVLTACALGLITMRLSGHYLPLGTIAWGLSLFYLFGNLEMLNKFDGITGIPAINVLGLNLQSGRHIYVLIWLTVALAVIAITHLLDSRSGRAIRALKGGVVMAESCGVNTARTKLLVFVLAAVLAGISGWLYAHLQRAVNPTPFGLNAGIGYLFMAVIGGAAHVWGALFGAALMTLLNDWLQELLPRLFGQSGNFEMIVSGMLLLLLLQRAPAGLWPLLLRMGQWLWRGRRRADAPPSHPQAVTPAGMRSPQAARALAQRDKPAAGTTVLEVRQARKTFGGLVAVNDVSFSLQAGEILGLIGPNGAGKSTMFNLLSGVLPLSAGEVHFMGQRVDGRPSRWMARAGMARTFQHVRLMPAMSVIENVAIGAHLRGHKGWLAGVLRLNRTEEASLFAQAQAQLDRVGLGSHALREAGSLALGQQRILEIARALASDPAVLLLDEPAAGLRHQEKQELAQVLRQLSLQGVSVLLVEHDMDFVMGLVNRLVVMDFGTRIAEGVPEAVRADPAVIEAYLGGGMNTGESARLLEVRNFSVDYGKVRALSDASLHLQAGSIVTVIGPNGAGKSTLLNAIMGVLPSIGEVCFDGHRQQGSIESRVAAGMSLVPERRELFGTMTVEDNLLLGGYTRLDARGRGAQDTQAEVFRLFPRLQERRRQLAGTLSGGERQMLAIGRALMAKPKILMLDEPSLGLAPLVVKEIFRIISSLRQSGVGILLVEQNARAALQVADYGYVLETGRITLEGPAAKLMHDARVAATYLGLGAA